MENILVLGGGYISSKIEKYWSLDQEGYNLVRASRSECDYLVNLDKLIKKHKPVFVVNCYGFTGKPNVDSCENYKAECLLINVQHTNNIIKNCKKMGVDVINISTGCVYNDENGRVFRENDPHNFGYTNPTSSIYSYSKSLFETRSFNEIVGFTNFYNLRIRMPFDDEMDDKNYINKIIKYDKLVNYQNSITYVPDLIKFIEIIVRGDVELGIYNVVNENPITAEQVLEIYKDVTGIEKKVDRWYSVDDLLSMGLMKCRRSNCVLSTDKIKKYYPELHTSEFAVRDALESWKYNNEKSI